MKALKIHACNMLAFLPYLYFLESV